MPKIVLSKEAAERIVGAGTRHEYSNIQRIGNAVRTYRQNQPRKVFVVNNSPNAIGVGEPLHITGIAKNLSYDELSDELTNKGYILAGDAVDTTYHPERPIAYALEQIPVSGTGECDLEGIRAVILKEFDTGDHYAKLSSDGNFSAVTNGDYYIIGKSGEIPQSTTAGEDPPAPKYLAYLYPVGGDTSGHLVGSILSARNQDNTTDCLKGATGRAIVTVYNDVTQTFDYYHDVGCPLLRSSEKLELQSRVVISKNRDSGVWQIIEAWCPAES